jgi:hypothetical protein
MNYGCEPPGLGAFYRRTEPESGWRCACSGSRVPDISVGLFDGSLGRSTALVNSANPLSPPVPKMRPPCWATSLSVIARAA